MRGDEQQIRDIPDALLSASGPENCVRVRSKPGHRRGHRRRFLWPVSRADTDLHTCCRLLRPSLLLPPVPSHGLIHLRIRPEEEAELEMKTQ